MPGPADSRRLLPERVLGVLMSVVVVSVGLLAIVSGYSPQVATRWGVSPAAFGADAVHVGTTLVLLGLFPLAFLAPRAGLAAAWAVACRALGLANAAFGAALWT
ncbi:hypothetical protein [Arenimonas sp.]|uniref:hypothetical protein n=1 Tax=Arenimonas sp. TaxID=1872635 RepID=UPI0035AE7E9F